MHAQSFFSHDLQTKLNYCCTAGLLLALFGGCQKYTADKNKMTVRGDPHVLLVGDPGLGKSQLLRSVSNVAPRGIYVCGNTTSSSGLTVTLVREGKNGDFALEAGKKYLYSILILSIFFVSSLDICIHVLGNRSSCSC